MNELPNETWTSAYLDGELTTDERAAFERWLADNPAAGQLLDELRATSQALRSLPREELGPEFAARVLQQAERAVLLPASDGNLLGEHSSKEQTDDHRPVDRLSQLADSPSTLRIDWKRWSRPLLWSAIASAAAVLIVVFSPRVRHGVDLASAPRTAEIRDLAESRPTSTVETEGSTLGLRPLGSARPAESAGDVERLSKDSSILSKSSVGRFGKAADKAIAAKGGRTFAAAVFPTQAPLDGNLIVRCEMTPGAVERQYFAKVLAKNSVSVENVSFQAGDAASAGENGVRGARNLAKEEVRQRDRKTAGEEELLERGAVDANESAEGVPQQTVYLVEASQEQLANVLAELKNDRREVLAVNVDPAPQIPTQQSLFAYTRDPNAYVNWRYLPSEVQSPALSFEGAPDPSAAPAADARLADEPAAPKQSAEPAAPVAQTTPTALPETDAPAPAEAGATTQAPAVPVPPSDEERLSESKQQSVELRTDAAAKNGRMQSDAYDLQNQVRQQIPVEEQKLLLIELENFSNTGQQNKPQEAAAPLRQNAAQNRGRAVQLELNRYRQITPQAAFFDTDLTKDGSPANSQPVTKFDSQQRSQERSGGGSAPKGGVAPRQQEQTQGGNLAKPGLQAPPAEPGRAASQRRESALNRKAAPNRAPEDRAESNQVADDQGIEPLVKAVFVIQARDPLAPKPAQPPAAAETPPNHSP